MYLQHHYVIEEKKSVGSHQVSPFLTNQLLPHSTASFILVILTFHGTITLCLSFRLAFSLFTLTSSPLPFFALSMPLLFREHSKLC